MALRKHASAAAEKGPAAFLWAGEAHYWETVGTAVQPSTGQQFQRVN